MLTNRAALLLLLFLFFLFCFLRQTNTTTILKEYYPGLNRLMYGVVGGNYEPDKHTSALQVNEACLRFLFFFYAECWCVVLCFSLFLSLSSSCLFCFSAHVSAVNKFVCAHIVLFFVFRLFVVLMLHIHTLVPYTACTSLCFLFDVFNLYLVYFIHLVR